MAFPDQLPVDHLGNQASWAQLETGLARYLAHKRVELGGRSRLTRDQRQEREALNTLLPEWNKVHAHRYCEQVRDLILYCKANGKMDMPKRSDLYEFWYSRIWRPLTKGINKFLPIYGLTLLLFFHIFDAFSAM